MQSDWSRVFSITTQELHFSQPWGFYRFSQVVHQFKTKKITLMDQIFLQNLYCWFFFQSTLGMLAALQIRANQRSITANLWQNSNLSCNNHCDRWLFQENFFYYFQKQPYADILQKNCNIHRKTSALEFLFYKVHISTLSQKRLQHRWLQQSENCEIFTNRFFYETPPVAAFVSLIIVTRNG